MMEGEQNNQTPGNPDQSWLNFLINFVNKLNTISLSTYEQLLTL